MRAQCWCAGFLLLFFTGTVYAQSLPVTADDVVTGIPEVQPPVTIQITQAVFNSLTKGAVPSPGIVQRSQLENAMQTQLQTITEHCHLTEEQVAKLSMVIQMETWRLMSDYGRLHSQYVNTKVSRDEYTAVYAEIFRTVTIPLAQPCGDQSLFFKVLRRHATPEQWNAFVELDQQKRMADARSHFADFFGSYLSLTDQQLDTLVKLSFSKYPRWRPMPATNNYFRYVTMLIAADLKDDIKPHLNADQTAVLERAIATARQVEPTIRRVGLWPIPQD